MPRTLLDLATVAVVITVLAAHVAWALADGRLPVDLGQYYSALPDVWRALQQGDLRTFASPLFSPGGWYTSLLAAWLTVFGRSVLAFRLLDAVWLGCVLGGSAWLARARGGPVAGLLLASLLGSAPILVGVARLSWIHLPEAALVVGLALVAGSDPSLRHWRTAWLGALGALLTVALRPSGLLWVPTLALLLDPAWRGPHRRRLLLPVGGYLAGLLLQAPFLPAYLLAKSQARERYALQVPDLLAQSLDQVGLPLLLVAALGWLLARSERSATALLWLIWSALPIILSLVTQVGLDNFTLWMPGVLGIASLGLARWPRVSLLVSLPVFAVFTAAQFLEAPTPGSRTERLYRLAAMPAQQGPLNPYRPWQGYGADTIEARLDEVCPTDRVCVVVADQGMVAPHAEEPGRLGLFLLGRDDVSLVWLADRDPTPRHVDALVTWACPDDAAWRQRFPWTENLRDQLGQAWKLSLHWAYPEWGPCTVGWWTPPADLDTPLFEPEVPTLEREPLPGRRERAKPGRSRVKD